MPGGDVMVVGDAQVIGLFGKLPAHGDFVRRGGPAVVLEMIDRWLDQELGAIVATGMLLGDAVDALDGAHGAFAHNGGMVLAALIAGGDGVGRRFPVVATLTGTPARQDAAAAWCAAARDALAVVRDGGGNGDAALAAIAKIALPAAAPNAVTGWWRGGRAALGAAAPAARAWPAALATADYAPGVPDDPLADQTVMRDGSADTKLAPPADAPPAWRNRGTDATVEMGDSTLLGAPTATDGMLIAGAAAPTTYRPAASAMGAGAADAALPDRSGVPDGAATGEPIGAGLPDDQRRDDTMIPTGGLADAALPSFSAAKRWWRPARASAGTTPPAATVGAAGVAAAVLPTGLAFRALMTVGRR